MRWRMFGHILRSDDNTPAYVSLVFAISNPLNSKGRQGRPRLNLFNLLRDDLKERKLDFNTMDDLLVVRELAKSRSGWRKLFNEWYGIAPDPVSQNKVDKFIQRFQGRPMTRFLRKLIMRKLRDSKFFKQIKIEWFSSFCCQFLQAAFFITFF